MPSSGHLAPGDAAGAPAAGPTVLASMARALLQSAGERGLDRARLVRVSEIDERVLEHGEGRIPRRAYDRLWDELGRQSGDPDLGLTMATSGVTDGAFGVVGFLAMTSATLGDALGRTAELHPLLKEGSQMMVREEGSRAVLEQGPTMGSAPWSRPVVDHGLGSIVVLARRWTNGAFTPKEVHLRHARPRDTSGYDRVFGCPVLFNQKADSIIADRGALELRLRASQPELAGYLETLAQAAFDRLSPGDLGATVRDAVRDALGEGDVGLPRVARRLGLSARTLQRRLTEQRLVYRDLVDEVRSREAMALVRATDLSMDEISLRLGYSESKAFRRAFRRWTGIAPADLRRGRSAARV